MICQTLGKCLMEDTPGQINKMKIKLLESQLKRILSEQNVSDINTYPACVANETSNKNRGELKKTKTGQYYIEIYIGGLTGFQFYNNGKVLYPDKKRMGNYSCKGNTILVDGHDVWGEKWNKEKGNYTTDYEKRELKSIENFSKNLDPHMTLTILQIGTLFIPLVGPFISAGIGLGDSYLYYKEGDTKTAGLVAMFSLLPGVGAVVSKIPGLKQLGSKGLSSLAQKIVSNAKLTKLEMEVAEGISKNSALIKQEINTSIKTTAAEAVKLGVKNPSVAAKIKNFAVNGIAVPVTQAVGYNKTYDVIQSNTPKSKAEKEGFDWEMVKRGFGSSGSEEDNKILNLAWESGWRPGKVVPTKYQTNNYKKIYEEEINAAAELKQFLSSVKK